MAILIFQVVQLLRNRGKGFSSARNRLEVLGVFEVHQDCHLIMLSQVPFDTITTLVEIYLVHLFIFIFDHSLAKTHFSIHYIYNYISPRILYNPTYSFFTLHFIVVSLI